MPFPAAAPQDMSVYRTGNKLVVSRLIAGANEGAALPPSCVKCGAPSAGTLSKSFYWHQPWVYVFIFGGLLPYALLAMILRKRIDLKIPLCAAHRSRRRKLILTAWLIALGGIAFPFVLAAVGSDSPAAVAVPFIAILVALIMALTISRPLVPTEINDEGGTFKGAGEGFLFKLP